MALTKDAHRFSTKCQCLRFILLDEISMVSAQLFGQLELIVAKVIRKRSLFKRRPDDGTSRPFGGVNVLMFGDWWQLKPVSGIALFADPALASSGVAAHGLQLLWGTPPNAVHRCWNFERSLRCPDPWFNAVLGQCRRGDISAEAYHLLNGFPSAAPVGLSSMGSPPGCTCLGACRKDGYYIPWVQLFLEQGRSGAELLDGECSVCKETRLQRKRVLDLAALPTERLSKPPFDRAPALYSYNVPRYYTLLQRSRAFAKSNSMRLSWSFAKDTPMHREDRDLTPEQLDEKRKRWLHLHDQHTSHIASHVPLVKGLPVRLTDSVDRSRALFRGRRGVIVGWVSHAMEESVEVDGEYLLSKQPQAIYIHFPGATWKIHEDLGEGVYPLTPVSRTWTVSRHTKVKVRRTGFFLVPDFASTAHMIQGQSLDAVFVDLVHHELTENITEDLYVSAYVMLSRVRTLTNLYILRHFSQALFGAGPPVGPHLLMQKLLGEVTAQEAAEQLKCLTQMEVARQAEARKRRTSTDDLAMKKLYKCAQCFLENRKVTELPPQAFGANASGEVFSKILVHGAWARCTTCKSVAARRAGGKEVQVQDEAAVPTCDTLSWLGHYVRLLDLC